MTVTFKMFRGMSKSWTSLFREACDFASLLEDGKLISISHSSEHGEGVVTVWYNQ